MKSWTLLKSVVFAASLLPLAWLLWLAVSDGLGANPIEALTRYTGGWALRFLLITLALTPLRHLANLPKLMTLRRMLGLYAFFYACLHVSVYFGLDQFFAWREILADITKRPYITVGFTAFVLLVPLALTSTQNMMRRLGRHWKRLHRLVYPAAIAAVLHFIWLVKADLREPLIYAAVLIYLLGYRIYFYFKKNTA